MRLESQGEGARWRWRCPECWATTAVIEEPPLDDRLFLMDAVAVLMSRHLAHELRVASDPVRLRVTPTDDPRVVDLLVSS
jgi:hypothetical protein